MDKWWDLVFDISKCKCPIAPNPPIQTRPKLRDKNQSLRNEIKFLSLAKTAGEEPVLCHFQKLESNFFSMQY